MAEKALQKVDDHLNCLVCLDTYKDPKLLQCHHVFCRECLERLMNRNSLACPTCRTVTPVPAGGVAGLQSAFNISHFLDILNEHKRATRYCQEHKTRELDSFCETCEKLICLECGLKQHKGHSYNVLSELVEKYKKYIESSLKPIEDHLKATCNARDALHLRYQEISKQTATLEAKICDNARQIQEAVEAKKVELISKLRNITMEKLQDLDSQRGEMDTTIAQLNTYVESVHKSTETSSEGEVVEMKTTVEQQTKELTAKFQHDLTLEVEADMKLSAKLNTSLACESLGDVFTSKSPDPAQCYITGTGLKSAAAGKNSTVILQAINYENEPCMKPIKSLESELVSELLATKKKCTIIRRESKYEIIYQPNVEGMHQLHIKINGQHIRGSPFSIEVKMLTFKADSPCGIAINQRGEVIVPENILRCVSVFSPHGDKLQSFDTNIVSTCGIAVDNTGNILVIDSTINRIRKFTQQGEYLGSAICSQSTTFFQRVAELSATLLNHKGIAFNLTGNRIYFLTSCRVYILNSDLTHHSTFGKDELHKPQCIACDSTGKVYIADGNIIKVFTAEGKFLGIITNDTIDESIGSIAVDARDMVYIYYFSSQCVDIFTSKGEFAAFFSTQFEDEEKKELCRGQIAVGKDGQVYLCEFDFNIVKVFNRVSIFK